MMLSPAQQRAGNDHRQSVETARTRCGSGIPAETVFGKRPPSLALCKLREVSVEPLGQGAGAYHRAAADSNCEITPYTPRVRRPVCGGFQRFPIHSVGQWPLKKPLSSVLETP